MQRFAGATILTLVLAAAAHAQPGAGIETRTVTYEEDGVTFQGYLAKPVGGGGDRPGVLVVHEWWGLNDYTKKRAEMLAELGYVAFAADMFGGGKTTTDAKEAGAWAGELYQNREKVRERVEAALDELDDVEGVDDDRLAAIGYCFGGTTVVELAYEEADDDDDDDNDLRGVVSFHGNPKLPLQGDRRVSAKVLLLHGGADPLSKTADVEAVAGAIRERGGDARVVVYPDAVHSFTNPDADKAGIEGVKYDQGADEKSWQEMQAFLREVFAER